LDVDELFPLLDQLLRKSFLAGFISLAVTLLQHLPKFLLGTETVRGSA
jgi:hypothetical protein